MAKIEPEGRRGKVGVIVAIAIPLFCLLGLIVYTQTVEPIVQVELDVFSVVPIPIGLLTSAIVRNYSGDCSVCPLPTPVNLVAIWVIEG